MNKNDNQYALKWAKKIKAINYLGGGCIICGEQNIFKLCFHHKDPTVKEFSMPTLLNHRWSSIIPELQKCEILCHNCHISTHEHDNESNRNKLNKSIYLEFKGVYECSCCGYNKSQRSLTFHHTEMKTFTISEVFNRFYSVDELSDNITQELNKCIILCANCHYELHIDKDKFYRLKSEIYSKINNHKEKRSKLDIYEVLDMYNTGVSQTEIAKHFECAKSTISGIIKNSS